MLLHKPVQYISTEILCTVQMPCISRNFHGRCTSCLLRKLVYRPWNGLYDERIIYFSTKICHTVGIRLWQWIYKSRMMKTSTFVYEFGISRFVKRNDNTCLHIRVIWWQNIENFILKEIDRWNIAIPYYMYCINSTYVICLELML